MGLARARGCKSSQCWARRFGKTGSAKREREFQRILTSSKRKRVVVEDEILGLEDPAEPSGPIDFRSGPLIEGLGFPGTTERVLKARAAGRKRRRTTATPRKRKTKRRRSTSLRVRLLRRLRARRLASRRTLRNIEKDIKSLTPNRKV